jgi:DNA processing protein
VFGSETELQGWLRLLLTPGIGNINARKLLNEFGLPDSLFERGEDEIAKVAGLSLAARLMVQPAGVAEQLQRCLDWLRQSQSGVEHRIVTLGDPLYPAALLDLPDPPIMLWMKGAQRLMLRLQKHDPVALGVVGSRNPSPQGIANAEQFSRTLGDGDVLIVSGLALGIDAAAHRGALRTTSGTIAVVGTGLDRIYPARNADLARDIAQHGLIISEYPLGTPPRAENFPKRNRLIAGLSRGVLVVEAAVKSGSLITARLALELGKEVMAVPGSIHSPQAKGSHLLIREGARLVESAQDVLEEIRFQPATPPRRIDPAHEAHGAHEAYEAHGVYEAHEQSPAPQTPLSLAKPLSPAKHAHQAVLDAMGYDPVTLEELYARTGEAVGQLQAKLLELELDGHVARQPGAQFQRQALA